MTDDAGSYDFDNFTTDDPELRRLEHQAGYLARRDREILLAAGLRDGMAALDLGCGPGLLTAQIAEITGPGRTVGLDLSTVLLAEAAGRGTPASFLQGSLYTLPFQSDAFEFVYSRLVFQHLQDVPGALAEIRRVLAPGGVLCLVDIDDRWLSLYPEKPETAALVERSVRGQASQGGDRHIGTKLGHFLTAAGFEDVDCRVVALSSQDMGLSSFIEIGYSFRVFAATEADREQASREYEAVRAIGDDPDGWGLASLFVACGREPGVAAAPAPPPVQGPPSPEIRIARTEEEKEAIYRLRFDIFGRELGLLGPLDQWDAPRFCDAQDEQSILLTAVSGEALVGTARVTIGDPTPFTAEDVDRYDLERFMPTLSQAQMAIGTRLMVTREYRRSPLARRLMAVGIGLLVERGVACLFIDCQPHLVPMYRRIGFRPYRSVFNDEYVGILVPLVLFLDDRAHLERIGSPLLGLVEGHPVGPIEQLRLAELQRLCPDPGVVLSPREAAAEHLFDRVGGDASGPPGLLSGLSEAEIEELVAGAYVMRIGQGDVLIHTGHGTRNMYLILDGSVELQADGKTIGFSTAGEVVGEFAELLGTERSCDVVAASPSLTVLALHERSIEQLVESNPPLAAHCLLNLARILCGKLLHAHH